MKNLLTIDLEDYFQVSGMADVVPVERWGEFESRIERSLEILLQALSAVKVTFFVLGWQAEKNPELIRRINRAGHEVATHGRNHRLVTSMTREEFKRDLEWSVKSLQDLTGTRILGHRAPSFSLTPQTAWAFEVIAGLGLKYDSSVFPVRRQRGGMPDAKATPYVISTPAGLLLEFPLSVWKFLGRKIPAAGGGFFRIYPYRLTRLIMKRLNAGGIPVVVYLHPWEFDPEQPRLKSRLSRDGFRHYAGLQTSLKKLQKLLSDFAFCPIKDYLREYQFGFKKPSLPNISTSG